MPHTHNQNEEDLQIAFFLNFAFAILEIIGGYLTNSIAIMADALHDIGDSITLAVSWRLEKLSGRKEDDKYSYGYKRFSLLSALIGAGILIIGMILVVSESVKRLKIPQPANANGMLLLSLIGILVNGYAAFRAGKGKSLNSQMIRWHLIEDALGWVAVLFVSIVLSFWDFYFLDPLLSIIISMFVLFNILKHLKKTINLFLQGVPDSIQIKDIEAEILSMEKVEGIHHTHLWSLDGEHHVLTTHIVLCLDSKKQDIRKIKEKVKSLAEKNDLVHTTIEFEYFEDDCSMSNNHKE